MYRFHTTIKSIRVNKIRLIHNKIYSLPHLVEKVGIWKLENKKIAFTNGVFDIIHPGHIFSLDFASTKADYLIVGVNADVSVKRLKGKDRPVYDENTRAYILASLVMVDAVILFSEDTPLETIKALEPDVLVKGGDYKPEEVVGAKEVMSYGGEVVINPIVEGYSTSAFIQRIKNGES